MAILPDQQTAKVIIPYLFKVNLGKTEMLIYVHDFNISDRAVELDFVFGQKDKEQWKVR